MPIVSIVGTGAATGQWIPAGSLWACEEEHLCDYFLSSLQCAVLCSQKVLEGSLSFTAHFEPHSCSLSGSVPERSCLAFRGSELSGSLLQLYHNKSFLLRIPWTLFAVTQ